MMKRLAVTLALATLLAPAAFASGLDDVDYQGAHADWTPGTTLTLAAGIPGHDDAAMPALTVRLGSARPLMADLGESIGQPEIWAAGRVPEVHVTAAASSGEATSAATAGAPASPAACGCAMTAHQATHG